MVIQHATGSRVGHYRARCLPGSCVAGAIPGKSNLERDIFTHLNSVFGGGKYDYVIPDREVRPIDMAFFVDDQLTLLIEYDGARWHNGYETRDLRKVEIVSGHSWEVSSLQVVRIREDPLRPLSARDVWVPRRADAHTCSRLALQHLAHMFFEEALRYETRNRIEHFLAAAPTPLTRDQVPCKHCWQITRAIKRAQAKPTPVLQPYWVTQ